jgi:Tol biopolymer transport system component
MRDIWLFDLKRGGASRLTSDPADDLNPTWSSDGSRIVFTSDRKGHRDIYEKKANGVGAEEVVAESTDDKSVDDVSADGRYIVYDTGGQSVGTSLWVLPLFGDRKPFRLLESKFHQRSAQFSPDGRYIAYASDESGRDEVYVQTFPVVRGRWQVSTAGGFAPKWRRDGRELFYMANDKLTAVDIKTGSSQFEAGIPKPLFDINFRSSARNSFVVTPDGRRFLAITKVEKGTTSPITVVLNWTADLQH